MSHDSKIPSDVSLLLRSLGPLESEAGDRHLAQEEAARRREDDRRDARLGELLPLACRIYSWLRDLEESGLMAALDAWGITVWHAPGNPEWSVLVARSGLRVRLVAHAGGMGGWRVDDVSTPEEFVEQAPKAAVIAIAAAVESGAIWRKVRSWAASRRGRLRKHLRDHHHADCGCKIENEALLHEEQDE